MGERRQLAERWVAAVREVAPDGSFSVLIHVGAENLPDTQALVRHAREIGADAVGTFCPSYYKPGTALLLAEWCANVASAAPDLPFYYYHIPCMNGVDPSMEAFLEAAVPLIPN